MKDFDSEFDSKVIKAESLIDRLISLRILTILIIITTIFIYMYGQILTAIVMLILFFYQRALINKFRIQVEEFKREKFEKIEPQKIKTKVNKK